MFDLSALTLEEKASLLSGQGAWETAADERLGIPSIMSTDGPHGVRRPDPDAERFSLDASVPATCFPTASALGSSWDVDLLTRVGEALGAESRAAGVSVLLGPGVNIKRSPLCGRNFEYLSEDPVGYRYYDAKDLPVSRTGSAWRETCRAAAGRCAHTGSSDARGGVPAESGPRPGRSARCRSAGDVGPGWSGAVPRDRRSPRKVRSGGVQLLLAH